MTAMAEQLRKNGCTLIGHLKTVLADNDGNAAFISITGFDQEPECKRTPNYSESGLQTITFNVVVYGITRKQLKIILDKAFSDTR